MREFKAILVSARVQPQEAGVALITKTIGGRRVALIGFLACAVALGGSAVVQGATGPDVTQAPTITGTYRVGQTLTASGGHWTGPYGTTASYMWMRCTDPNNVYSCSPISNQTAQTYRLVNDDLNKRMRVALVARDRDNHYDYAISNSVGPVSSAGSSPTPTPTPTPTRTPSPTPRPTVTPAPTPAAPAPTPTPTPDPSFDVAAAPVATPVPTSGEVLHQTATSKKAKMIRPKPVVRVRGRLTANGARITAMTVKAPRGTKIAASCSGGGCPAHKMTRNGAKLTHLSTFEKTLRAGTRITIRIAKPGGYITKVTVLEIRRGGAPMRRDGCLWPAKKKLQRCPGD